MYPMLTVHSFDIHFDLIIRLESALMTFSLEIDGVKLGSVETKFHD